MRANPLMIDYLQKGGSSPRPSKTTYKQLIPEPGSESASKIVVPAVNNCIDGG